MRQAYSTRRDRIPGALAILLALVVSTDAHGGELALSWRNCVAPLTAHEQVSPGGGPYSLHVSVAGQVEAHRGYEVRLRVTAPEGDGALPDAWRFDAAGCQPSTAFEIATHLPALSKCPELTGAAQRTETATFAYDPKTGTALITLRVDYGDSRSLANPVAPHVAAYIRFNHLGSQEGPTVGMSCGGLERAICIRNEGSGFLDGSLALVPWFDGGGFASASTSATPPGVCAPAGPVKRQSWGSTKSQYR